MIVDSCDEINGWISSFPENTISVDNVNFIEGTGSLQMQIAPNGGVWSVQYVRDFLPQDWTSTPILKLRLKTDQTIPDSLNFGIGYGPELYSTKYSIYNKVIIGEFTEITINLLSDAIGTVPDLSTVRRLEFSSWETYIPTPINLNVDYIERTYYAEPPTPPTTNIGWLILVGLIGLGVILALKKGLGQK